MLEVCETQQDGSTSSQEELEDKFAHAPRWLPGRDEISTEKKQREREGWRNLVSGCTQKLLRAVIVRNALRGAWSSADPTWSKLNPKLRPALMCGVGAPRAGGVWDQGLVEGHRTSCGSAQRLQAGQGLSLPKPPGMGLRGRGAGARHQLGCEAASCVPDPQQTVEGNILLPGNPEKEVFFSEELQLRSNL